MTIYNKYAREFRALDISAKRYLGCDDPIDVSNTQFSALRSWGDSTVIDEVIALQHHSTHLDEVKQVTGNAMLQAEADVILFERELVESQAAGVSAAIAEMEQKGVGDGDAIADITLSDGTKKPLLLRDLKSFNAEYLRIGHLADLDKTMGLIDGTSECLSAGLTLDTETVMSMHKLDSAYAGFVLGVPEAYAYAELISTRGVVSGDELAEWRRLQADTLAELDELRAAQSKPVAAKPVVGLKTVNSKSKKLRADLDVEGGL